MARLILLLVAFAACRGGASTTKERGIEILETSNPEAPPPSFQLETESPHDPSGDSDAVADPVENSNLPPVTADQLDELKKLGPPVKSETLKSRTLRIAKLLSRWEQIQRVSLESPLGSNAFGNWDPALTVVIDAEYSSEGELGTTPSSQIIKSEEDLFEYLGATPYIIPAGTKVRCKRDCCDLSPRDAEEEYLPHDCLQLYRLCFATKQPAPHPLRLIQFSPPRE